MRIIIPNQIYQKVMYWVNKTQYEVSGFGKVELTESGDFRVLDAFLLPQEGGHAHTDIDAAGLGKLMYTTKDQPGHLNWWWHSHVKMETFWSAQDKATITGMGKNGFCTASVFNQRWEVTSAFAAPYQGPLGLSTFLELWDVETEIEYPEVVEDPQWEADFKANVREPKFGGNFNILGSTWQDKWDWDPDTGYYKPRKEEPKDSLVQRYEWEVYNYYCEEEINEYSKLLNMTPADFAAIYETGTLRDIEKLEARLDHAKKKSAKKAQKGK